MVLHTCNLSTQKVDVKDQKFVVGLGRWPSGPDKCEGLTPSQKFDTEAYLYNPNTILG